MLRQLNFAMTYRTYKFPVNFHPVCICRSYANAAITICLLLTVYNNNNNNTFVERHSAVASEVLVFSLHFQQDITFCATSNFCAIAIFVDALSLIQWRIHKTVFFWGHIGRQSPKVYALLSRLSGLGERRQLPQLVLWVEATAVNDFWPLRTLFRAS